MEPTYRGFAKYSGPTKPPESHVPSFGYASRPPSHSPPTQPFPTSAPLRAPRGPGAVERVPSPPLAFKSTGPAASLVYQRFPGVRRGPEAAGLRPLALEGTRSAASPPYSSAGFHRPVSFSNPVYNWPKLPGNYANTVAHQDQYPVSPSLDPYASTRGFSTDHDGVQVLKRNRSPPLPTRSEDLQEDLNFAQNGSGRPVSFSTPVDNRPKLPVNYANSMAHQDQYPVSPSLDPYASTRGFSTDHDGVQVLKRNRSPLPTRSEDLRKDLHFARNGSGRPVSFSTPVDNQPKLPGNYANSVAHQDQYPVSSSLDPYACTRGFSTDHDGVQVLKRNRSPPLPTWSEDLQEDLNFARNGSRRPAISPTMSATQSTFVSTTETQMPQRLSTSAISPVSEVVGTKLPSSPAPKRSRSPSPLPSGQLFPENSFSTQDDTEREMLAKAKRLARFKTELKENVQSSPAFADQKVSAHRNVQSMVERDKDVGNQSPEFRGDFTNANALSDYDGSEQSSVIIGLCPDMCPESERAERERKGDLDRFERLDGDRNQTSKTLAVKKYTRTAEREANLIRPMPILRKTIDYLLYLLDLPYDDKFLGIYNFLWDRMRAIRMDLRMQHIFNQGAIVMLEQMIRLHIIAMHELCEHTKGEGFSEGFDAHLNIEQMNKTSVELFQIYDDHRKKGINVPTEKEFRGYYALLKLDKHPGYKVEPAELSLDLAKMTPEIRQTPEVLFARDVARSCRTGNFIAFFRLARKASYLQACLMHAHFAKLRTQALASLHSGLQNNQGLPVAHVAQWLGMEDEDIESLLQYHGFSMKVFEEPYMMKEGPFLNHDKDYPTKCSELVHLKKSRRIVEDVSPSTQVVSLPAEVVPIPSVESESSVHTSNEEVIDLEAVSSSTDSAQQQPMILSPTVGKLIENDDQEAGASTSPWGFLFSHSSPKPQLAKDGILGKPNCDELFRNSLERNMNCHIEEMPVHIVPKTALQGGSPDGKYDHETEKYEFPSVVINRSEDAEPSDIHGENEISKVMANDHDEETAEAKLKLILRLWKRRCTRRRELREQRQEAANAALNSLSLGPPIRQKMEQPSNYGGFDIDHVMGKRHKKLVQSWSRINVSDVVASILSRRNTDAKCLCWKIIVCAPMNNLEGVKWAQRRQVALPTAWLLSKLMPSCKDEGDNDLVISSPGLSIWRNWVASHSGADMTCCLSVVKNTDFDNLDETVSGASAVLFLASENIPWQHQKIQLHSLLSSIPAGSRLPLLILSCLFTEETPDSLSIMVNELGLHDIDKSRISSFHVAPLIVNHQMEHSDGFFSNEQLREGLKWLASESPLQPVLHWVKTRELVLSHLNSSLEVLERKNDYEAGPNECVAAFNEALDWSLGKIAATAKENPAGWPCPEIGFLEESNDKLRMQKWYLPKTRWNSLEKIEPLMCALRDSKLPAFTDDISWVARGSYMGKEIKNQRLQLEDCLVRYMTQSSKMMRIAEAMKEAYIILQKSARLELKKTFYCIVPNWVVIFRRIFNWRLMNLSSGAFSMAYILECHIPPISRDDDTSGFECSVPSPYNIDHPSLDEVIEVGCSSFFLDGGHPTPEHSQHLPPMLSHGEVHAAIPNVSVEEERDIQQDGNLAITTDESFGVEDTGVEIVVGAEASKEAENLSKLLQQCNIMQNMLDKKLSVYF